MARRIKFLGKEIPLPGHPLARIVLGVAMVIFGVLGFLPILGFWMLPLGLLILSVDLPPVRRFRRYMTVVLGNWIKRRWPMLAKRLGLDVSRV